MTIEQMVDAIGELNSILGSANLRPTEKEEIISMRSELRERLKGAAMDIFRQRAWAEMQRRTPGPFVGEKMTGGPRNIPGSEGSGVVIQPRQTPGTFIRNFVPNAINYRDRMSINPARLQMKRNLSL